MKQLQQLAHTSPAAANSRSISSPPAGHGHSASASNGGGGGSAAAGLQAALWLRLGALSPLLPLVYADREPAPEKNLRTTLVPILLR